MLDLTINASKIEKSFDRIAGNLINDYLLIAGEKTYEFTEIEFYYNKYEPQPSVDNFAHHHGAKHPDGTWRLHGAGLDIVFKKVDDYYGGILIRGLRQVESSKEEAVVIDGPWNTATTLIRDMGIASASSTQGFYLKKRTKTVQHKVIKSPRVGLFLKKEEDLEYICKPWRYISVPIVTKKYRHLIFLQLHHDWTNNTISTSDFETYANQIVSSTKSRENYLKDFKEGQSMETKHFISQKNTVANTCRLFGHYISKQF